MKVIVANAFSINMLTSDTSVLFTRMSEETFKEQLTYFATNGTVESAIGHSATAAILSQRLGLPIAVNRANVRLERNMLLYVAQVSLPRLTEGQVLSEDEMKRVPISYWSVSTISDTISKG